MFSPGLLSFEVLLMRYVHILGIVLNFGVSQVFGGGFSSLKLGVDARSGALGMAYTALSEDGSGGYWNPASLASLRGRDFLFSIHQWIADVRGEFFGLGWGKEKTGLGIYLLYTEVGDIEHRIVPLSNPLGTFSAHELIVGISYARMVTERLSVGMTLKTLYEKIFIDEASGVACDVGVLWKVWEEGLRVGAVIQNLGKTGRLREEEIKLPLFGKVGFAFPIEIFGYRCILALDGVKERGFPFHIHGGVEYGWRDILFLRFGYQSGYETRNVTGGAGIVWGRYRLDYSMMPLGSGLGDSHRLSLGVGW